MVTLPASWPGDNEEKQKIKMTTPVAMRIRTEPVFAKTTNNYTIAFWVPEILQVHALTPRATIPGCRHDFDPVPTASASAACHSVASRDHQQLCIAGAGAKAHFRRCEGCGCAQDDSVRGPVRRLRH